MTERGNMADNNNLRAFRKYYGLSLKDVSAVSGLSAPMLSRVETGHRELSGLRKIALAQSLGVPVEKLFPRDQESTPA